MKGKIANPVFSHARVKEVLDYDPTTGVLKWKMDVSKNVKAGMLAGGSKGYIAVDKQPTTVPRIVWFYMTGEWPERRIKFKNGNIRDYRFDNLEVAEGFGDEYDHKDRESRIAYHRRRRSEIGPKRTDADLKRVYGISLAEYADIAAKQNNKCAICFNPETQFRGNRLRALAVDHCHTTGKVRGLLCSDCNTGIGKLKDDPKILQSAIRYLEKHLGTPVTQTGLADAAQTV